MKKICPLRSAGQAQQNPESFPIPAAKVTDPPTLYATVEVIPHKPEPDRRVSVTVIRHKPKTYRVCVQVENSPYDRLTEMAALGWAEAVKELRGGDAKPSKQGVK